MIREMKGNHRNKRKTKSETNRINILEVQRDHQTKTFKEDHECGRRKKLSDRKNKNEQADNITFKKTEETNRKIKLRKSGG